MLWTLDYGFGLDFKALLMETRLLRTTFPLDHQGGGADISSKSDQMVRLRKPGPSHDPNKTAVRFANGHSAMKLQLRIPRFKFYVRVAARRDAEHDF